MLGDDPDLALDGSFQARTRPDHGSAKPQRGLVLMEVVLVQLDQVNLSHRPQRLNVAGVEHSPFAQPVANVVREYAASDPRSGDFI